MSTVKLVLTETANGQANYLNVNEALARLDQLVQAAVTDRLAAPPGSPTNGALYLIIATATGVWSGKENQLAYWLSSVNAWTYVTPREGMLVHVNDEDVYYKYTGSAWAIFSTGMSNPMTTSGDIIIGGASGAPQRLGPGTDTYVLTMVSGVPAWQAPSGSGSTAGDMLSPLLSSEVSITGAVTLLTSALGKMHVCSGTTADYTVGLPAVSGNAGKFIGFRMAAGLTKLVTLDGNGAETIDGATTRVMWANETAILYCDGSTWTKIAGKSIPMRFRAYLTANQSIPTITSSKVLLDGVTFNDGGVFDAANNQAVVRRPGGWSISGGVNIRTGASGAAMIAQAWKNGVEIQQFAFGHFSSTTNMTLSGSADLDGLVAGDTLQLGAYSTTASPQVGGDPRWTFLSGQEVVKW